METHLHFHDRVEPAASISLFDYRITNRKNPDLPIICQGLTFKGITIGCDVWLDALVAVLNGVAIGDGCVIGARAVITKSVRPYSIAAGVPAKIIGRRLPEPQAAVHLDGKTSKMASENRSNDW